MSASVAGIYIASSAASPLQSVGQANLEAGRGLVGDRYYAGTGTFSEKLKGKPDSEVTLIEQEEIERFNSVAKSSWSDGEFRRNIVTSGARLNELVGRQFSVGGTLLEGIRLCEPCSHLARLMSPAVVGAMVHRSGLRARIISGGPIRRGDRIEERSTVRPPGRPEAVQAFLGKDERERRY